MPREPRLGNGGATADATEHRQSSDYPFRAWQSSLFRVSRAESRVANHESRRRTGHQWDPVMHPRRFFFGCDAAPPQSRECHYGCVASSHPEKDKACVMRVVMTNTPTPLNVPCSKDRGIRAVYPFSMARQDCPSGHMPCPGAKAGGQLPVPRGLSSESFGTPRVNTLVPFQDKEQKNRRR